MPFRRDRGIDIHADTIDVKGQKKQEKVFRSEVLHSEYHARRRSRLRLRHRLRTRVIGVGLKTNTILSSEAGSELLTRALRAARAGRKLIPLIRGKPGGPFGPHARAHSLSHPRSAAGIRVEPGAHSLASSGVGTKALAASGAAESGKVLFETLNLPLPDLVLFGGQHSGNIGVQLFKLADDLRANGSTEVTERFVMLPENGVQLSSLLRGEVQFTAQLGEHMFGEDFRLGTIAILGL